MRQDAVTMEWIKSNSSIASECWLWRGYVQSGGYGQIRINGKPTLIHRLSWSIVNGAIPCGLLVCHTCDTPACVNPAHLFLGTAKDNAQDCKLKGRMAAQRDKSFTKLPRTRKLSHDDARIIFASKLSLKELSEKYHVSKTAISQIRNGKRKQLVNVHGLSSG